MQFLEIYNNDNFYLRIPIGEIDLMEIRGDFWVPDVVTREKLIRLWLEEFFKKKQCLKRAEYYLVFESKMNLLASDNALSEVPCDAPFITCNSIEQVK